MTEEDRIKYISRIQDAIWTCKKRQKELDDALKDADAWITLFQLEGTGVHNHLKGGQDNG